LRGAGVGVFPLAGLGHETGFEEGLHQRQHALVLDPSAHPVHQGRVIDRVETRLDVSVEDPAISLGPEPLDVGDRVVRPPLGPKPVGDRLKVGLEDRFQHKLQRRLDRPVADRGDAQLTQLPRSTELGDHALTHRQRPERTRLQLGAQIVQEPPDPDALVHVGDGHAVHPGGVRAPVARDPVERYEQRRRVTHEIEQIIEPAARIGRPTVELGLHLRYPPTRPLRDHLGRGVTVRRRVFRHCSLHLLPTAVALPHVIGFPDLGVLRRLRPARRVQQTARLSPPPTWPADGGEPPPDGSRVHCGSLDRGGARLCPCGLATATPPVGGPRPNRRPSYASSAHGCPRGSPPGGRRDGTGRHPVDLPRRRGVL
jgi:hypothetical protein